MHYSFDVLQLIYIPQAVVVTFTCITIINALILLDKITIKHQRINASHLLTTAYGEYKAMSYNDFLMSFTRHLLDQSNITYLLI